MDHIFGKSDDISFGTGSKNRQPQPNTSERPFREPRTPSERQRDHHHVPARRPERKPHTDLEPPTLGDSPALTRLISGMKASFLPSEDDMNLFRTVILSPTDTIDPLVLLRADTTTILVGSGFSNIIRSGKEYPTFPDMRLIFSEKDRLHAWILTNDDVQVEYFEYILPTLGFPPIYATRDIIAKFRNNIKNTQFLDQCRFFELFTPGVETRRIGDFEFSVSSDMTSSFLSVRSIGGALGLGIFPIRAQSLPTSDGYTLTIKDGSYILGQEKIETGEILMFKNKSFFKHSLKYTFDTFYVDNSSIGVVAGYTLTDREILSENGVLMFTLEEDSRARTITGHIFIDSRGFVHAHEMMAVHKEILKGIRVTYEKLITENERIERGELVQSLRREITKYCFLLTGRTPLVMPIIIER